MKKFKLDSHMTSLVGGGFYPTGHSMIMFPNPEDANRVGHLLIAHGVVNGDEVYLVTSQDILEQIAPTTKGSDYPLPSAGTEAATVRIYIRLAREGHVALLVKTRDEAVAGRVMELVRQVPYSAAECYRRLVIEDL